MMPRINGRGALIITATMTIALLPFVVVGELPGERWLSANDENAMHFALAGAALLAADVLLPIPSSIIGTMLAVRLGPVAGFAATFAGMMVGQSAAYWTSRVLLRNQNGVLPARPTLAAVFLSRPVPVFAEALAFAAGAARLSWPQFLLACAAGNLVYAGALTLNASQLMPDALIGPGLLFPMLLPVATWLIWQRIRRSKDAGD